MARYRGPRIKICRAVGMVLPGLTAKVALSRANAPGQHGADRRRKPSDFKIRLQEKQKCRWHFGILEKQFQNYVKKATSMRGPSGQNLMLLLQSRLDNIVYRMGLAVTIPAARQLVVHGHILVNGKPVDRPSYHVSPGDEVALREKSKSKPFVQAILERTTGTLRPSWIEFDPAKGAGKLISPPERADLTFDLKENAIIEFYSQKL